VASPGRQARTVTLSYLNGGRITNDAQPERLIPEHLPKVLCPDEAEVRRPWRITVGGSIGPAERCPAYGAVLDLGPMHYWCAQCGLQRIWRTRWASATDPSSRLQEAVGQQSCYQRGSQQVRWPVHFQTVVL
jgi:hypothetical protein